MIDGIKALVALERVGTLSEAAVQLRLTQSALSKRIQALENELGYKVVEPDGRRLRLSPAAHALLSRAKPLLAEWENLKIVTDPQTQLREFTIGISDSIASTWGPALLKQALGKILDLKLEIHVHRSTLIVEHIKLGRYELGLVTGLPTAKDLVWTALSKEPMVLIGSGKAKNQKVLCIESVSATWKEIGPKVLAHEKFKGREFEFVESFAAAAQMARENFGQALVPLGVARSLGFKEPEFTVLAPTLHRQIYFTSRKSVANQAKVLELAAQLVQISTAR